jgi:methyl-accepting chemotaxis protein
MSINIKLLAILLTSQLAIAILALHFGNSATGWGACIGVALLALAALSALIHSNLLNPLEQLRANIQAVKMEGNLALRMTTSNRAADATARTFNDLLDNFQSIIGKVMFNSEQVATSAQSLKGMARQVATGSHEQQQAAEAVSQAIEQMIGNIHNIAENASQAAHNAGESRELSSDGAKIAQRAATEIGRTAQAIEESATAVNQLGERSQRINGIAQVISEIAEQTNLLALNAAIEAARAGESGRGFAVVADEVRKLAERTSSATREISAVIDSIQADITTTISTAQSGSTLAREGAALAQQAAEALTRINHSSQAMLDKSAAIASAITQQTGASELIGQKMRNILDQAGCNSGVIQEVQEQAAHLDHLAVNLKELDSVFKIGESGKKGLQTHAKAPDVVQTAAHDIESVLERALASGKISEADLFDENYVRIPGVEPPKFHTSFDKLTDELFPAVQEAILQRHPEFVYAGAVDRNGYFPTHNKKFSAEPTGDLKKDTLFSRSKRIFSDPVGKRCGSHTLPFLIQTYRRDTGEVVHDISTPIYVRGKQWGGFRIGYKA